MNFLNKIFKKKNKKIYSDDSYIKSKFINYEDKIDIAPSMAILFTFSNDYCPSAIEIVNSKLASVYIQSSVDKTLDELDEDGYNKIICIPKNYLLINGNMYAYANLLRNIDISNPFVTRILSELYDNVGTGPTIQCFSEAITDGIMHDEPTKINPLSNTHVNGRLTNTDIEEVLKLLPSEFTGVDLLKIFKFKLNDLGRIDTLYNFLYYNDISSANITDDELQILYKGVVKHPTIENLMKLTQPLYKREVDEEETTIGSISTVELDQIFQEKYDRFSAIINDNTSYMDIDEVISKDDPEYNNLQSDEEEEY